MGDTPCFGALAALWHFKLELFLFPLAEDKEGDLFKSPLKGAKDASDEVARGFDLAFSDSQDLVSLLDPGSFREAPFDDSHDEHAFFELDTQPETAATASSTGKLGDLRTTCAGEELA